MVCNVVRTKGEDYQRKDDKMGLLFIELSGVANGRIYEL